MQRVDGRLVLSATDLTKHVACPHVTTLDLAALDTPATELGATEPDDALNLIFEKGIAHEKNYLESLRAQGLTIVEIASEGRDEEGKRAAEAATVEAMRDGADVVYQATLYDGEWIGYADFLLKCDRPSEFGDYSYDIADTKLARRLKVPALLQMATYAERLMTLQGVAPAYLVVVTGDKEQHPWRLVDVAPYARRRREALLDAINDPVPSEATPTAHCAQCRWETRCATEWLKADDLVQVAGIRGSQRQALRDAGITTMAELAAAEPRAVVEALGSQSAHGLQRQATLQVEERTTGEPAYELLTPEAGRGLQRLPQPSDGDVYLDFEGDPWADDGVGREYLAGLWDRHGAFTSWWAHDAAAEKKLVEDLIDHLMLRWQADPQMHVYHYAAYERTALQRLTGRYGTREAELDQLLRAERLVDLYAVVRQGVRVSKPSYSIKKLEDFYWGHTRSAGTAEAVGSAMDSVIEYERWLVDQDQRILERIEAYNREDVRSTHDLHGWLEQLRDELEGLGVPLSRPVPAEVKEVGDAERAETELASALVEAGHELLAGLVGWHRREARPAWWEFFRYAELATAELVEDATAIGDVGEPIHFDNILSKTGKVTSKVWRYPFPPQDCKVVLGQYAQDVDTHASVGKVVDADPEAGWIDLSMRASSDPPSVRGLGPPGPLNDQVLRDSLASTGRLALRGGDSLALRLLHRQVPSASSLMAGDGESPADVVRRVGTSLGGDVLAVQGPPGTGKTYAAARLICALLDQGKKVGVTALSHSVIRHVLEAVERPALQKVSSDEDDSPGGGLVELTTDNGAVLGALTSGETALVGGSAWLWSRTDMAGAVDVLVVDEAGQFSLANAVAVSPAATSMVLLGDPQQLSQPTQAVHPFGAGVSALEHLLDGHDTMPADRGVFLGTTRRMHPSVTEFVSELAYEGRLDALPGLEQQVVGGGGQLGGHGLRWVPVEHVGRESSSPEEAAAIGEIVDELLTRQWTNHEGVTATLREKDILLVAPFNAQVATLRALLPDGIRVGTVDKFQGREGAVVIYSLTSSSAADAPRGVGFLYDLHRLNVAVSRARSMSIILGNPALLDAPVNTPEQLRSVNALCRYVDDATTVSTGESGAKDG
ncbi:TM0106 family RecB-like putative nuclease [Pedococcus ginsenosidimutans]|uniref:TM0106 family RecB-like putative nuclease n=1 Tax=Pedococcus ginsenosidimutans TaxID=490570 RepID=A0ABP8Y136_9MICO